MTVSCDYPYLVSLLFAVLLSLHLVTFLMFFITCLCKFFSSGRMPDLRVVITQQQTYALTGSIPVYQVLATLAVLAEGLLTQASIQTPSQPFSEWMTKPVAATV